MSRTHIEQSGAAVGRYLMLMLPIIVSIFAFFTVMMASMSVVAPSLGESSRVSLVCAVCASVWFSVPLLGLFNRLTIRQAGFTTVLVPCLLRFTFSLHLPLVMFGVALIASLQDWNPDWVYPIALILTLVVPPVVLQWLSSDPYRAQFLRGTRTISMRTARQRARVARRPGEAVLGWCGIPLPDSLAVGHFLLVGAPGSGKTVSLRLLMQSVLPHIHADTDWRALIYDAKQDILPILSGMKLRCPVVTLNALDHRGAAWDMARDIDSHAVALQVAANLIPEEQGHNAFFVKAARDLLAAVMVASHLSRPGGWTLADVVLTLSDRDRAKRFLQQHPETAHIAREYFTRDPRTLANIQQTITAHMSMLRPIAAAWARATHRISLHDWFEGEFILVLGNDESLRGPIDALNAAILQRLSQIALAQSESQRRRMWFFLDELKAAGKLDCVAELMTKGRSKGVRCFIAIQTIEGFRDVYGDHKADDITGLCTNKAFLRTDSVITAKWAAEIIGEAEWREWRQTRQTSGNGSSTSMAEQIVIRATMLACELMRLLLANERRYFGYFVTPGIGVYRGTVRIAGRLCGLGRVANFLPRPPEHQYIMDDGEDTAPGETAAPNGATEASLDDLASPWEDDGDWGRDYGEVA